MEVLHVKIYINMIYSFYTMFLNLLSMYICRVTIWAYHVFKYIGENYWINCFISINGTTVYSIHNLIIALSLKNFNETVYLLLMYYFDRLNWNLQGMGHFHGGIIKEEMLCGVPTEAATPPQPLH